MMGLALILVGLGTGVLALDLLLENVAPGSYPLVVLGTTLGHVSGRVVVLLVVLVAAAAAAILTYGAVVLRRERGRRVAHEATALGAFLESHRRILTERIEELQGQLAELETAHARAREELELDRRRARRLVTVADRAAEGIREVARDVVVVPEVDGGRPARRRSAAS